MKLSEKSDDTEWVTKSCKSKDRQYIDYKKHGNKTNNGPQNTTHKHWATRTQLITGGNYVLRKDQ